MHTHNPHYITREQVGAYHLFDTVTTRAQPRHTVAYLARRYRFLYQQASRRKKVYLKAISKTHTLRELCEHAKRVHFS